MLNMKHHKYKSLKAITTLNINSINKYWQPVMLLTNFLGNF